MARAALVMQGGVSAGTAKALAGGVAQTFTAAGTSQTDAKAITQTVTYISTAAASSGAILPLGEIGDSGWIHNAGANTVKIYPPTSCQINALGNNAGMSLAINTSMQWMQVTTSQFVAILSA